jgi:hypothetical protein
VVKGGFVTNLISVIAALLQSFGADFRSLGGSCTQYGGQASSTGRHRSGSKATDMTKKSAPGLFGEEKSGDAFNIVAVRVCERLEMSRPRIHRSLSGYPTVPNGERFLRLYSQVVKRLRSVRKSTHSIRMSVAQDARVSPSM